MLTAMLLACLLALVQPQPQPQPHPSPSPAPAPAPPAAAVAAPRTDGNWMQRHEAFNARARQGHEQGDIGVIFLGDSITEGWAGAGRAAWEERYAPRRAVNFGIGGDRTQHLLWRIRNGNLDGLAAPRAGSPPAVAVIMIGTNNTGSDSAQDIAAGIGAVVAAVREKLPEARVLLLGVFPRGREVDDPARAKIADINGRIAELADGEKVVFLDLRRELVEKDGSISAEVMPDFLHLSEKGYRIWADAMEPALEKLLGEADKPR